MSETALPNTDSDSPWKELIEVFFPEFIRFFLPVADPEIAWDRGYEFLDKELQQITADAEVGRRYADKLVKVWTTAGLETWVLVHVEVQGTRDTAFEERMFVYRYRIYDRFRKPTASVAILADEQPNWRPDAFETQLWGSSDRSQFVSIKLLDYQDQFEQLLQNENPFAIAVAAHLKALQTKQDRVLRKQWKLELLKLLYERGMEREQIIGLFKFIDWLLSLPEGLALEFRNELSAYEQERRMPYITSIERIGREKGRQEGRQEGETLLVLRQLSRRFGQLPEQIRTQIAALPISQLETLGEELLDFSSMNDLENWLSTR
ncbi:DUF4351 domain-containing protein (plasmid) [Synechococcus elongatus IITB7]|uniref:DUF4351 domain-containing protein n=1 Tax=Synechococcus elongatus TaxID=32046 RepID=UPI0030D62BD9